MRRANAQVYSSINEPYEGAKGSMIRRMFKRLPGVGAATAKLWYNMGFRRVRTAGWTAVHCWMGVCWACSAHKHNVDNVPCRPFYFFCL